MKEEKHPRQVSEISYQMNNVDQVEQSTVFIVWAAETELLWAPEPSICPYGMEIEKELSKMLGLGVIIAFHNSRMKNKQHLLVEANVAQTYLEDLWDD